MSLPYDIPDDALVELVIKVDDTNVNLREMGSYLDLTDRAFGRMLPGDLRSYAQRRENQLTASFRRGSLEVVLQAIAENKSAIACLVALRFLLKYLPAAYCDWEKGRLARTQRKQLREQMEVDRQLQTLEDRRRKQLARYFGDAYSRERRSLPAARRFANHHIRGLALRVPGPGESVRREERTWSSFSLASAMRGMENENGPDYTENDLNERLS